MKCDGNGIYIPHFLYTVHIQMWFTLFQCKGEIGHQHLYIGTAGSHYQSISDLTQPNQPMNHEIAQRPNQHTGNSMPYSLLLVCGFFNIPIGYEH